VLTCSISPVKYRRSENSIERPVELERINTLLFFAALTTLVIMVPSSVMAQPDCAECHDEWFESAKGRENLHPPFEEDDCSSCHEDHGDSEKLMLAEEGPAVTSATTSPPGIRKFIRSSRMTAVWPVTTHTGPPIANS
jgi:predicted CXXCH cytochrome family protein